MTTKVAFAGFALAVLGVGGSLANLVLSLRGRAPWVPFWLPMIVAVAGMAAALGAMLVAHRALRRQELKIDAELARIRALRARGSRGQA